MNEEGTEYEQTNNQMYEIVAEPSIFELLWGILRASQKANWSTSLSMFSLDYG